MKTYLEVANSPVFYLITFLLIGLIILQVSVFVRLAMKKAAVLRIDRGKIMRAVKTAAVTSFIPSVAIVVALITMVPVLGLPFSWARLSVIGSMAYELTAANFGAEAMGVALGQDGYTTQAFLNSVWTMVIGSSVMLSFTVFLFKGYKEKLAKSMDKGSGSGWSKIFMTAILLGVYSKFILDPVVAGGPALVAMVSSALLALLLDWLTKRPGFKWLQDFSLSISMIAGMACACLLKF